MRAGLIMDERESNSCTSSDAISWEGYEKALDRKARITETNFVYFILYFFFF